MNLAWYAMRLSNMSRREIGFRVKEAAKRRASKYQSHSWEEFAAKGKLNLFPQLRSRISSQVEDRLASAVEASAQRILAGEFSALGVQWPKREPAEIFAQGLWSLDPVTGQHWPTQAFCFSIPYRHERALGDIKYVWEANRLQQLQVLAASWMIRKDEAALAAIRQAIESWMAGNPPFRGIGWNSGIELAMRIVSLAVVLVLCGQDLGQQTLDRIESLLRAHHYWLNRFPSRHSSANNHLIAELLGEFVSGHLVPDLGGNLGHLREELTAEAMLQFFPDGVNAEQSPTYGAFSAEMLLLAELFGRESRLALDKNAQQRLQAFARHIGWIGDCKGLVPCIGDDDAGRVIATQGEAEECYAASIARAINGFYGQSNDVAVPCEGPALRDAFFGRSEQTILAPMGQKSFLHGGYSVVREIRGGRKLCLTMDHGPLGYLSIAAHGHADVNAITLALDDEDVLVDPGTYLYHSGGAWRDWFRGTAAHNTLCVNGADQSTIAGPFFWKSKAIGQVEKVAPAPNWLLRGSHDGYQASHGLRHVRQVTPLDDGILIEDSLEGTAPAQDCSVTFQFAPALDVRMRGDKWIVMKDRVQVLTLSFSRVGDCLVTSGQEAMDGGWVSPSFGRKIGAPRLVWKGRLGIGENLRTSLTWPKAKR